MGLSNEQLVDIAEEYGTPLYVYDGDLILKRYSELYELIPWNKLRILYAMKANYNPAVLKLLASNKAYIDAVSPGDATLALKCGFPAKQILYTANNITDDEMKLVHSLGVRFNIGSLSRLEKFGKAFPESEVCLRFNPDIVAGAHKKMQTGGALTKFGILLQDVARVKELAHQYKLRIIGLHKHTGSGIKDTSKFAQAMNNLLSIATPENFPDLSFVDFGGGFGVPYHPDEERIDYSAFGKEISDLFSNFCKGYGRELEMYYEPGKYVVAEAGQMLVRVNTLKNNRGRLLAGTDSGFPQLIRPMFYEAYHHIVNLSNPNGSLGQYDVCGNICETGDCFATERELPEIREGDILSIENAGAYCYAMGGVYNLRSMPAEVLVIDEEAKLVRKRLSEQELVDSILAECP